MKINWKVRAKNPYFWFGLIAVVLAAVGVSPESITSWGIFRQQIMELVSNPCALVCTAVAVVTYVNDPTTQGINDSPRALTYSKPNK